MRRLVFAGLMVLLAGCSRPGAGRIDPALASLVPADTVLLAGARLERLRATPLYRKFPLLEGGLAGTGLDERNIYEVLVVSDGKRTAALARGKFAPADGSEPRINLPNATRTAYKGYTLIASGGETVTFMNASTVVAGTGEAVRGIIDQRGRSSGIPAALERQLATIPQGCQLWAVGAAGSAPLALSENVEHALAMTESFLAAAEVGESVNGFATLTCRNEQDATDLGEALKALLALARLGGIQVEQRQRTVRITVALSEAELGRLARK